MDCRFASAQMFELTDCYCFMISVYIQFAWYPLTVYARPSSVVRLNALKCAWFPFCSIPQLSQVGDFLVKPLHCEVHGSSVISPKSVVCVKRRMHYVVKKEPVC